MLNLRRHGAIGYSIEECSTLFRRQNAANQEYPILVSQCVPEWLTRVFDDAIVWCTFANTVLAAHSVESFDLPISIDDESAYSSSSSSASTPEPLSSYNQQIRRVSGPDNRSPISPHR